MPSRGKLIALEGPDDSAISTLQERLYSWLQGEGVPVERAGMPTRGPIGLLLRMQAQERLRLDPASLALLWTADRLDLLGRKEGVRAWLSAGRAVLCAHYRLRAYAALLGAEDGDVDPCWIAQIDAPCPAPDLTLYLAPRAAQSTAAHAYTRALDVVAASGARSTRLAGGRALDETARACRAHIAAALAL
jgi:dTMP kinase